MNNLYNGISSAWLAVVVSGRRASSWERKDRRREICRGRDKSTKTFEALSQWPGETGKEKKDAKIASKELEVDSTLHYELHTPQWTKRTEQRETVCGRLFELYKKKKDKNDKRSGSFPRVSASKYTRAGRGAPVAGEGSPGRVSSTVGGTSTETHLGRVRNSPARGLPSRVGRGEDS